MAVIAVSELNADIAFVAANAGGDTVASGIENAQHSLNGVYVLADNGDVAERTITIDGVAHAVPAGELHALPANKGVYPGTALAVTYDAVTSLTVAAIRT